MELSEKNESFSRNLNSKRRNQHNNDDDGDGDGDESDGVNVGGNDQRSESDQIQEANLRGDPVMEEVNRFIDSLSSTDDKSNPPEIPQCVETLADLAELLVSKYSGKFGENQEEDSKFVDTIHQISILEKKLLEFQFPSSPSCVTRITSILQGALSLLDDEFRSLLDTSKRNKNNNHLNSDAKTPKASKHSNHELNNSSESDRFCLNESEEAFHGFSDEEISTMNKMVKGMVSCGYEQECSMIYSMSRRSVLNNELNKINFEGLNTDDILKMHWEALEEQIALWISTVKTYSSTIFPEERKLCDSVFSDFPLISKKLFSELVSVTIMRLLNFPGAILVAKRSSERLFKFLDMYEALRGLIAGIDPSSSGGESMQELISEISIAEYKIGEAAVSIFCELENSIKSDNGKTPVPSGSVHPLTRYTMNYLKYACEYKDTLEQVFQQHLNVEAKQVWNTGDDETERKTRGENDNSNEDGTPKTSPFAVKLLEVMDLLDDNLDKKSKLYKDPALSYIFLMNNGRYIWQKIKGSTEIHEMMGHSWTRKRSSDLRLYHKSYQRETWGRVLQCMSHDGLQTSGKTSKSVVKERFKCLNAMFDDIHKTQSSWVVCDEQLQSELRISISAVVIPAYRSFLGRFKQILDSSRQAGKYIKYQPEDIETLVDDLFDGNPVTTGKKKGEHK